MNIATGILILKAAFGAGIVVLMSWLGSLNIYFLIGLIPLFPTFSIIGHSTAWSYGGV